MYECKVCGIKIPVIDNDQVYVTAYQIGGEPRYSFVRLVCVKCFNKSISIGIVPGSSTEYIGDLTDIVKFHPGDLKQVCWRHLYYNSSYISRHHIREILKQLYYPEGYVDEILGTEPVTTTG